MRPRTPGDVTTRYTSSCDVPMSPASVEMRPSTTHRPSPASERRNALIGSFVGAERPSTAGATQRPRREEVNEAQVPTDPYVEGIRQAQVRAGGRGADGGDDDDDVCHHLGRVCARARVGVCGCTACATGAYFILTMCCVCVLCWGRQARSFTCVCCVVGSTGAIVHACVVGSTGAIVHAGCCQRGPGEPCRRYGDMYPPLHTCRRYIQC